LNGAFEDYIKLALFSFTLKDRAKMWFNSLLRDSVGTQPNLSNLFLSKFFPHKRTAKIRAQISVFRQVVDESMSEVWKRYRELLNSCPHHNIPDWMIVEGFYQCLTDSNRTLVNSAVGGKFMQLEPDEALRLFDRLATQEQWMDHDRRRGGGGGGRIELDQFSGFSARIDALQK
jgi:Retrotransposon gag protein